MLIKCIILLLSNLARVRNREIVPTTHIGRWRLEINTKLFDRVQISFKFRIGTCVVSIQVEISSIKLPPWRKAYRMLKDRRHAYTFAIWISYIINDLIELLRNAIDQFKERFDWPKASVDALNWVIHIKSAFSRLVCKQKFVVWHLHDDVPISVDGHWLSV